MLPAKKTTLAGLIEATAAKSFKYTYDFGDDWEHAVKIERLFEAEAGAQYPRFVEATGRCPPEDVGGPWGYEEYWRAPACVSRTKYQPTKFGSSRSYLISWFAQSGQLFRRTLKGVGVEELPAPHHAFVDLTQRGFFGKFSPACPNGRNLLLDELDR